MEPVESIKIPESHISFANDVAELAEKNGVASFILEYKPHWRGDDGEEWDRRVRGNAKIHYSAKDGRGRPCRNLSVSFDASVTHVIESNQESCS